MGWNRDGTFTFEQVKTMNEDHLCRTIACNSPNISIQRKNECRKELIKRWTKEIGPKKKQKKKHNWDDNSAMAHDIARSFIDSQK